MVLLANPITAIVLCLLLGAIAVSGKLSQHAANVFLTVAWCIGVFALMRSGTRDWRLLGAGLCAITAVALFVCWWVMPPKSQPLPHLPPTTTETIPKPSQAPIDADELASKLAKMLKEHPVAHMAFRARLHVTKFEWTAPVDVGGHAEVKVLFANNGNAPITRLIFAGHMGYFLLPEGRESQLAFEEIMNKNPPDRPVQENEIPIGVDRSFVVKSSPWSQQAIDRFLRGDALLYAAGVFTYSDSHMERKARFCGYTDATGNMKFCAKGNEEP